MRAQSPSEMKTLLLSIIQQTLVNRRANANSCKQCWEETVCPTPSGSLIKMISANRTLSFYSAYQFCLIRMQIFSLSVIVSFASVLLMAAFIGQRLKTDAKTIKTMHSDWHELKETPLTGVKCFACVLS
ncbi:hypothetical protein T11_271 [Trichinella zimbabwensis]|uniref:Uncharacterized protein n=1 Tax=Trichinella zimbabwensis TaxID=268475 RepID=A0A0V1HK31_9BILA|nr:hypothetical protein T11_271 [Trichinella zimbabwensis]